MEIPEIGSAWYRRKDMQIVCVTDVFTKRGETFVAGLDHGGRRASMTVHEWRERHARTEADAAKPYNAPGELSPAEVRAVQEHQELMNPAVPDDF